MSTETTSAIPQHDPHASHASNLDSAIVHAQGGLDCCKSLACQCACVHVSLNSVTVAVPAVIVPDHPAVLGGDLPNLRARIVELFKPPI